MCFIALFYFFSFIQKFLFLLKVVNLCCSGEKSWTRKRYLLFLWNIKSPNFKSQWEIDKDAHLVVYIQGMPMLYPYVTIKAWAIFVTFHFWDGRLAMPLFRWIVIKSSRLLFLLTLSNADFEGFKRDKPLWLIIVRFVLDVIIM